MKTNYWIILIMIVLSISLVSALDIKFFYSPTCPHCQNVIPLVQSLYKQFPYHNWLFYDVTKGSYNITGVPLIQIKDGCYNVEIGGDTPILENLKCEVQQQSTPECITKPAYTQLKKGESWFIN